MDQYKELWMQELTLRKEVENKVNSLALRLNLDISDEKLKGEKLSTVKELLEKEKKAKEMFMKKSQERFAKKVY